MKKFLSPLMIALGSGLAEAAFIDNSDGTVTDTTTKLMWDKCAVQQIFSNQGCVQNAYQREADWPTTLQIVKSLNEKKHRGYSDWRLPNKNELESALTVIPDNTGFPFPALTWGGYATDNTYWSSTISANPAMAWLVSPHVVGLEYRTSRNFSRLVREGQSYSNFNALGYRLLTITPNSNVMIQSLPAGIDCGDLCSKYLPINTNVTLNATPNTGYVVKGWSEACAGNQCVISMSSDKTVSLTVAKPLLKVSVDGAGGVTSQPYGINCPSICESDYNADTTVKLTQTAASGYVFTGWTGACTGNNACEITVNNDISVMAHFKMPLVVSVSVENKVYDGTASASVSNCRLSGIANGDLVDCLAGKAIFDNANIGDNKSVTATEFSLSGPHASKYIITNTSAITFASIGRKPLTLSVTAARKPYDGTTNATISSCSPVGVVGGDNVTCSGGVATFEDSAVGGTKKVTATGVTIEGASIDNYALSSAPTIAYSGIYPREVAPDILVNNKVYDGNRIATIKACNLSNLISGETVSCTASSVNFQDSNVGANKRVDISGISLFGTHAQNYVLSNTTQISRADITAKSLTAAVTSSDKTYDGSTTATISACTLTGVVAPDVVTCAVTSAGFADANVGKNKTVTATGVTLAGANANKYTLSSTTATTTANILKAPQAALTVSATPASLVSGGEGSTLSSVGGSTGGAVTYSATASPGLTCSINGTTLTATGSAGTCTVTATMAGNQNYEPVTSAALDVPVTAANVASRLINIATRGQVGTGDNVLIGGFVISGIQPKKVLIRAIGPSMAGVAGTLANPQMTLTKVTGELVGSNDDWASGANAAQIQAMGRAPTDSRESALLLTLEPNIPYTPIISGVGNTTGVALVEVYDVDDSTVDARLINIATRGRVGTSDNVLIGGFVINGTQPKKVLIRAIGPSMAGVSGTLANPQITLSTVTGTPVASNDDWQSNDNAAEISAMGRAPSDSRESALLVTLQPNTPYTPIVSGVGGTTGVGLVEVYEMP